MACTLSFFPYCSQCSAIKANGHWNKYDGNLVKTTQKLHQCSVCHLARYCSKECQMQHWPTHRSGCFATPLVIPQAQVDAIVARVCAIEAGSTVVNVNANLEVTYVQKLPVKINSWEVRVSLQKEDKLVGNYSYLLCSLFDWQSQLDQTLNPPPDEVHNPEDIINNLKSLGKKMTEAGFIFEAIEMFATHAFPLLVSLSPDQANKLMEKQNAKLEKHTKLSDKSLEVTVNTPVTKELPESL